jgi:hypothetical protein
VVSALLLLLVLSSFLSCSRFNPSENASTTQPPALQVRFESECACARLSWVRSPNPEFRSYDVQQYEQNEWSTFESVESIDDTTLRAVQLEANRPYQYRVVTRSGNKDMPSNLVRGRIHGFANAWPAAAPSVNFLPTRLAVDEEGVVLVVGAGTGMVLRFDRAGNPLNSLRFADARLACLGLGTLDGPALALDSKQNVYVVYNVLKKGTTPEAFFAKFDADGALAWNRPLVGLFTRNIAVDENDQIFVESLGQIRQYDENGKLVFQGLLPPLMVSRMQLWDGKFAVLAHPFEENARTRLQLYEDPIRSPAERTLTHELPVPIAADFAMEHPRSRIFVVNSRADRIEVYHDGQPLTWWGSSGKDQGEFAFSGKATTIDDLESGRLLEREVVAGGITRDAAGSIYVADTFNNRIQKFWP